jgi:hypothetical protein
MPDLRTPGSLYFIPSIRLTIIVLMYNDNAAYFKKTISLLLIIPAKKSISLTNEHKINNIINNPRRYSSDEPWAG